MSSGNPIDLSACALWLPSIPFGGAHIGLIPAWNAVTLLNPSAAIIWDLLADTSDDVATAATYAKRLPERANAAEADVAACIRAWDDQGLLCAPAPSEEARRLEALGTRRFHAPTQVALRQILSVGGIPTLLDIEDPALADVVQGLLADFPETTEPPQRHLHVTGPEDGWILSLDGTPARAAPNLVLSRGQIVAELVRIAAGDAGWRAIAHGAVLSAHSGAILLAGASGAGKSTLSAGLIARGWRILAEDLAAFGPDWTVCPLPFTLSIKAGAVETLRAAYPDLAAASVHHLGTRRIRYQSVPPDRRATQPERPRMIFEVGYDGSMDAAPASCERLSAIDALALFLNEESYIDFERDDAVEFLDFVERTPAFRIRYGSTDAAEACILEQLEADRAGPSG